MKLMQSDEFKEILQAVNTDWSIEERVRYVLHHLGVRDETIIHIVTRSVIKKDLCQYTIWQQSGFLTNLNSKCEELFVAINDFLGNTDKHDLNNTVGIVTFIETLQENIIKGNEITPFVSLFM